MYCINNVVNKLLEVSTLDIVRAYLKVITTGDDPYQIEF
jgi:hypothetical protein